MTDPSRLLPTRRDLLAGTATAAAMLALPAAPLAAQEPAAATLCNPAATPRARAVYAYLWSIYGKRTLTGQQESFWLPEGPTFELDYLRRTTGQLPAILGLDYIEPADFANVNDRATRWFDGGGLPSICWHWGAPDQGTGYDNSKKPFDLPAAMRAGTPQNRAMMRDIDQIADQLTVLRDRNIPVLWRPLHEFSGDWFWWGKWGPARFRALWALIFDHFTRVRGLNNLIWVLGYAGQNIDPAYYPGRSMVDIAGADLYVDHHGPLADMFGAVQAIVGTSVPICLHENGPVPDPAGLGPQADWLWFLTWHTRWLTGPDQNTAEGLRAAYASDRYVTLSELPDLKG
ncbi:glycoside hydrolase family 26 protein [Sphingomonas sp. BGYR3]|uniref:glycoside hydrolase family 26 protein n=1 Tax=Sphingomonas sp. BGYR3 TaxID=2975483 RepID=UPI0021A35C38|nr:glycoside hydrolase family 26 protein [Sphingomonas sp. BGYR3]MDG5487962.1 glycoside hydrolase family 26 protein [Sphingomonas sp. BGYR3]